MQQLLRRGSQLFGALIAGIVGAAFLFFGYQQWSQTGETQTLIFAGVGVVVLGVGLYRVASAFRKQKHRTGGVSSSTRVDKPWAERADWAAGRIKQESSLVGLALFTVLWNLFSWPIAGFAMYDRYWGEQSASGEPWVTLIFPAVGLVMIGVLAYKYAQKRKFGETIFEMDAVPGRIGGALSGMLQTGVPHSTQPADGFHVKIACIRRREYYRRDSDGNRKKEVDEDELWRDEKRIKGTSSGSASRTSVPIFFDIPEGLYATKLHPKDNRILWRLTVEAELPGIDFATKMEVPVYEVEEPAGTDQRAVEARRQESGGFFWDADGGEMQREETLPDRDEQQPSNPYQNHEILHGGESELSRGITVERTPSGGRTFHFGRARSLGTVVLLVFFLALMIGFTVLMASTGSLLGGAVGGLFVAFLVYGLFHQLLYRSTITVEKRQVVIRAGMLRQKETIVPARQVTEVKAHPNGNAYDLHLHRSLVGDAKLQREMARSVQGTQQVVSALEKVGLASEGAGAQEIEKKLKQSDASPGRVVLARHIKDKQEADWLAEEIERATRI